MTDIALPETAPDNSIRIPGYVFGAGGLLVVFGTFLPWITRAGESMTGLGRTTAGMTADGGFGPGHLVLIFGALLALAGSLRGQLRAPLTTSIIGIVVSVLGVLLLFGYYNGNVEGAYHAGYGLWLSILGMLIAVGGAIWALIKRA